MLVLRIGLGVIAAAIGLTGVTFLIPAIPNASDVVTFGMWFLLPPILSDAVLMPAIAVGGFLAGRVLPHWLRTPVTVALVVSAALVAIALPFLGRPGLRPDNTSLLDRNYPLGLAIYLVVVWVAAAGWALVRRRRPDSTGSGNGTVAAGGLG